MKDQKKLQSKNSRRSFLGKGVLSSLAVLTGLTSARSSEKDNETVKLLTPDGQLVEVEKRHLPPKKGKKISNRKLFEWMHKHR